MTGRRLLLALALLTTILPVALAANPLAPNDTPDLAVPATDTFVFAQPTTGATHAGEPRPCGGIGNTVWYAYSPSNAHWARASTHQSNYDTVLAVYVVTSWGPLPLACNDDAGAATSAVTWWAEPERDYLIQAGGYNGRAGILVFRLEPVTPTLALPEP